jgi:hypothetical protein
MVEGAKLGAGLAGGLQLREDLVGGFHDEFGAFEEDVDDEKLMSLVNQTIL